MRALFPLLFLHSRRETADRQRKDTEVQDPATDADGDGFSTDEGDCVEGDASLLPGAVEPCNDLDNNCHGSVEEGLANT